MKKLLFITLLVGITGYCLAQNQIKHYEYWFDDNFSARTSVTTSVVSLYKLESSISTEGLPAGLHTLQIRFQDNAGLWSSTASQFFIKVPKSSDQGNQITKYEYCYDSDHTNLVSQTISASDNVSLTTSIGTDILPADCILYKSALRIMQGFGVRQPVNFSSNQVHQRT